MAEPLNLIEETIDHLKEGARSVNAHGSFGSYIITRAGESDFWVTIEAPPFEKTRTDSLEPYFKDVFGIQANY